MHIKRNFGFVAGLIIAGAAVAADPDGGSRPWLNPTRSPDERANMTLAQMTLQEKIDFLHSSPVQPDNSGVPAASSVAGAIRPAGRFPGVARLGIPALLEVDGSLGVGGAPGNPATAMPSGLVLASTFNPQLAFRKGANVGAEAHAKGFDVLLGGGMNLTRDPRNGRNFEYLGEDPLLAGILAGEEVRGTQSQHVISTVKHFVLNANETNRFYLDAKIDKGALRESDLLSFQMAIERGQPGAIMCAYNKVNADYSCGNSWLLNEVLKRDWQYRGWVMSDWGATYAQGYEMKGLDQQSGVNRDPEVWFGAPLKQAVESGTVPASRIDDMVRRILRSMFAVGVVDHPPVPASVDYQAHADHALEEAREGIVLLKNQGSALPLAPTVKRIAVIGGLASLGVLSAGHITAMPIDDPLVVVPVGGQGNLRSASYIPSSPMAAIQKAAPNATVLYEPGSFPENAAALAAASDVAIVFATRQEVQGADIPNIKLPQGQDALIDAVATANPNTIVVLETGNPVAMPWLGKVSAVLSAWYPGQAGGQAIADILFGAVNPSGHLPITFPVDDSQTMRPKLPNFGADPKAYVSLDYSEGADVGYRWYRRVGMKPLFAFGHGLSYSSFGYSNFSVMSGKDLSVSFDIKNESSRSGADVPQVYLISAAGEPRVRLIGFQKIKLDAGEQRLVTLTVDRRLLARFDEHADRWRIAPGVYRIGLARSAEDVVTTQEVRLQAAEFK